MLKKADIIKLKQVDHVISENNILADINFPFLVSIVWLRKILILQYFRLLTIVQVGLDGFSQDERYLYFLLKYIPGGELFSYLRAEGTIEPDAAR